MKERCIKPEFFDTINYAICQAVNEYLSEKAVDFFRRVGEHHLNEALERGLIKIDEEDKPLDVLIKIARYLESVGYMKKIVIHKLSDDEALVEMFGVSVWSFSHKILSQNYKRRKTALPLHDKHHDCRIKKVQHQSKT